MKIGQWFAVVWGRIGPALNEVFSILFEAVIKGFLSDSWEIAKEEVFQLSASDLPNDEKRREAAKRLKARLIERGLTARDSLINLVIELAVQAVIKYKR